MRLYLSSFRLGDHAEELVPLVETGRTAAVIANALDDEPPHIRDEGVQRELGALSELGLPAQELDLRDYFGSPERAAADLRGHGLAWLRGGNVFLLRYALAASGADGALIDLLRADAIVYGGYSAGPCVLGPTLRGFELVDEPGAVPETYGAPTIWDGLGVLDYPIVPHVDSPGHPETERCGALAEHFRSEDARYRTLRDGQALVVEGATTRLV